jgi:hypothetical protein
MAQEKQLTRNEVITQWVAQLDAPVSLKEFAERVLSIYLGIQFLRPEYFAFEDLQLVDTTNRTIPTEIVTQQVTIKSFLGEYTREVHCLHLGWLYKKHKIKRQDGLY